MLIDTTPLQGTLRELGPVELQQVRRTADEPLCNSLLEHYHYLAYQTIEGVKPSNWPNALQPIRPFAQTGRRDVPGAQAQPVSAGGSMEPGTAPAEPATATNIGHGKSADRRAAVTRSSPDLQAAIF